MGTRKGRAKAFDTSRPSAWDQTKQHEEEEQDQKQHRGDEEDQQGGPTYLEVLVQEVEEQQDGDQEGQGKGLSQKHALCLQTT